VLESGFKLDSLACTYVIDPLYIQSRLAQNSACAVPPGTLLLSKSGSVCLLRCVKADSHIPCRSAKGLDGVFPI
jgi:hypothetical protein